MVTDTVPLNQYGVPISVPAGTSLIVSLWDIPLIGTDGEGDIDDEGGTFFLKSMIGTWHLAQNQLGAGTGPLSIWRLMMLPADFETGVLVAPWQTYSMVDDNEPANLSFFDERMWDALIELNFADGLDVYAVPWHRFVNLTPGRRFGMSKGAPGGVWPAWVIENNSAGDIRVMHRWRAFVSGNP